jgi:TRAP-type C4-dicarboxylate transport system substrate-binding protein
MRTNYREDNMFRVAVTAALVALAPIAAQAQAQFTMKIGSPTVRSALEEWTAILKKNLEARTNGRIKVEGYPGSQLGAIPRMIEGVQLGTIEAAQVPADFLSGIDLRFGVSTAPGLLKGVQHGRDTLNDPEFKAAFWNIGQDKGIVILAYNCDTPTDWATRNPIHKMDDVKGLKLRVFGSPMEREMLARLGATGVPMPLDEVLPAIQRRVIDGNKAGITVFVPFKYYDTVKYVWKAKESTLCVLKFASKAWLERLPGDLRTAVTQEALKAADEVMPYTLKIVEESYAAWQANGGTLTEFAADEQKRFYDRIESVGDDVLKDKPQAREIYQLMKKVAKRHDKM